MRYKEFIIERPSSMKAFQAGQQEPTDWEKINLRTIQSWIEHQSLGTNTRVPKLDNALLLVGMVGDPKFRDRTELTKSQKMTQLVLGNEDGHKLMNKYAPGEKITLDTLIRATKQHTYKEPGTLGDFTPATWPTKYDPWKIRIGKQDKTVRQFRSIAIEVEKNYLTITQKIDDDVLDIRGTFFHECMHRGIAYWKLLVAKGQITPSVETKWVILESNLGRDGWGAIGKEDDGIDGEHAVIYNRLKKKSSYMRNFPRNWHFANKDKLKSDFGIKSEPRLDWLWNAGPDGEDVPLLRYYAPKSSTDSIYNDKDYNQDIKNFLDDVYEKLSNEIAQFLGAKIKLPSKYNKLSNMRGTTMLPGTKQDNNPGETPGETPTQTTAFTTTKERDGTKEVAVEILTGLLTTLKDPKLRFSIEGYTAKDFAAHVSSKANITTARANEILLDTVEKIFIKYKTITPAQVKTAVRIIFFNNKKKAKKPQSG